MLSVVGKGDKLRQVPVPALRLVEELQDELEQNGLEDDVCHESNRDVAILTRFEGGVATPWSASGLAKGIKEVLGRCAASLEIENAKQLRKASTHWFRHTHGSHALNGRPGGKGVPIQVVQNNLGHASIGTTSGYLTTERDARLAAMKGFGEKKTPRTLISAGSSACYSFHRKRGDRQPVAAVRITLLLLRLRLSAPPLRR